MAHGGHGSVMVAGCMVAKVVPWYPWAYHGVCGATMVVTSSFTTGIPWRHHGSRTHGHEGMVVSGHREVIGVPWWAWNHCGTLGMVAMEVPWWSLMHHGGSMTVGHRPTWWSWRHHSGHSHGGRVHGDHRCNMVAVEASWWPRMQGSGHRGIMAVGHLVCPWMCHEDVPRWQGAGRAWWHR